MGGVWVVAVGGVGAGNTGGGEWAVWVRREQGCEWLTTTHSSSREVLPFSRGVRLSFYGSKRLWVDLTEDA